MITEQTREAAESEVSFEEAPVVHRGQRLAEIKAAVAEHFECPEFAALNNKLDAERGIDETTVCGEMPADPRPKKHYPTNIPEHIVALGNTPTLTREQAHHQFVKYNYLKSRIDREIKKLGGEAPTDEAMERIETLYGAALETRNFLITRYQRFVIWIANKTHTQGMDLPEKISHGNNELFRALELFDPNKGFTFGTHARQRIYGGIIRAKKRGIDLRNERIPTVASKDLTIYRDMRESSISEMDLEVYKRSLEELLSELKENPRQIIEMRFGLCDGVERNYVEIAEELGTTYKAASSVGQRAMGKLLSLATQRAIPLPFDLDARDEALLEKKLGEKKDKTVPKLNPFEETVLSKLDMLQGRTLGELKMLVAQEQPTINLGNVLWKNALDGLIEKGYIEVGNEKFPTYLLTKKGKEMAHSS